MHTLSQTVLFFLLQGDSASGQFDWQTGISVLRNRHSSVAGGNCEQCCNEIHGGQWAAQTGRLPWLVKNRTIEPHLQRPHQTSEMTQIILLNSEIYFQQMHVFLYIFALVVFYITNTIHRVHLTPKRYLSQNFCDTHSATSLWQYMLLWLIQSFT